MRRRIVALSRKSSAEKDYMEWTMIDYVRHRHVRSPSSRPDPEDEDDAVSGNAKAQANIITLTRSLG